MNATGFINSWIPYQQNRVKVTSTVSSCHLRPRMGLLSHEKLEVLFSTAESEMAKYKLEVEIPGTYTKQKRRKCIQTLKQNANYRGFRKGTVPPFIMKTIPGFVLRESVDDILTSALTELELKPIEGEAAEPDMDMDKMLEEFVMGEDFKFTLEMSLNKHTGELTDSPGEEIVDVATTADLGDFATDAKRKMEAMKGPPDIAAIAEAYAAGQDQVDSETSQDE